MQILPAKPDNPTLVGALLMVFAVSCVAVDTMIIRHVAKEIHPFEIAFFRNLFGIIVVSPWLFRNGFSGLKTKHAIQHVLRAAFKLFALVCFFFAISGSPLALVTAIAFSSPLFITLGSMAFLGEPKSLVRLGLLLVGFCGVLVVIRPGITPIDINIVLALMSALGLGVVGILMKFVSMREDPHAIVSLNILLTLPAALLLMLPFWIWPSPQLFALMALQGILGGMAQLSVSRAMSMADASIISPLEFLRLPLVAILAWVIFREPTGIWTIIGGVIIFTAASGLLLHDRGRSIINRGAQ